ncbi:hypothetical protein NCS52_00215100 [Fusarium sp. LHS14.1]|nr:hypothetical protein NCS52_00215100 [Fusarium sp. LHS14.1]
MDPFRKLPQDLRLMLLVSLDSLEEVDIAAQASPALLQQLQVSRGSIIRQYVLRDGDLIGDVLQDALAIIKFPRPDATAANVDAQQRLAAIHGHLCKWGDKEFPDPFHPSTRDIPTMLDLHTLCRKMWLYIEDYLSKATSYYLPRAYRRLPPWSHHHFSCNPSQIWLQKYVRQFDTASLGRADRRKILQAFLRYELLCKTYGPVAGKTDTQGESHRTGRDPFDGFLLDQSDPFLYWNWYILYMYERRLPGEIELQLLPCVREYVLAMYGAIIANQIGAPIPVPGERPHYENAPLRGVRNFPDRSPSNEPRGFHHIGSPAWSNVPVSLMATVGFDLLTTTLTSNNDKFFNFLFKFNMDIRQRPPLVDKTNVNLPITTRSRRAQTSWYCNDYLRLNRQRAWPLFCNTPKYPQIPSLDEYERVYGPGQGPGPIEGLIGWGLGVDRSRTELIAHGQGRMAYSSLIPMLKPFWE